jgi:hypothetical protein
MAKTKTTPTKRSSSKNKKPKSKEHFPFSLNARPDTVDFRDLMYVPTLHEVSPIITLEEYRSRCGGSVTILDQGKEGACTGYALANVANFLLRSRKVNPDKEEVSPKMLYRFARRYDEWPGEKYSGSSARGAMKAWHKHGVCSNKMEEYWDSIKVRGGDDKGYRMLIDDSRSRPLGAYFRFNHKDLVAMHSAMAEVVILFVTANVHESWRKPIKKYAGRSSEGKNIYESVIEFNPKDFTILGGHAFTIVAYDLDGFWVQNSWGEKWGDGGFAKLSYDDWLINGTDVWVARLGAPVKLSSGDANSSAYSLSKTLKNESSFYQFRSHVISLDNDGLLKQEGTYGHGKNSLTHIISGMDVTINTWKKKWSKRRILLYAHGGLVPEDSVLQRLSDYREALLNNEIFPVFFMWHSDFWSTVRNILNEALTKRNTKDGPGGIRDFMMERADDFFEYTSREPGRLMWGEMKKNALGACSSEGGVTKYLSLLKEKIQSDKSNQYEIHLIGHSAGSILLGPVVEFLKNNSMDISTCTLWAPACTVEFFFKYYQPAIESNFIKDFNLYTLTDTAEQNDDCASIYNKSLLYLLSNSFEEVPRVPVTLPYGTPILGMEKFISTVFWGNEEKARINNDQMGRHFELCRQNALKLSRLMDKYNIDWIRSPSDNQLCSSQTHGGFDDDKKCLESSIAAILKQTASFKSGRNKMKSDFQIRPSKVSIDERVDKLTKKQEILNLNS